MSLERDAKVFAALSDPMRLRIVRELRIRGQACGKDLSEELGISLALVCHHNKVLAEAGILSKGKNGQSAVYSINQGILNETLGRFSL